MEPDAGAAVWRRDVNLDQKQSSSAVVSLRQTVASLPPPCSPSASRVWRRACSCAEGLPHTSLVKSSYCQLPRSLRHIAPDRRWGDNCRPEKRRPLDIFQTVLCKPRGDLSLEIPGDLPEAPEKTQSSLPGTKKNKKTTTQWPILTNLNMVFTWPNAANPAMPLAD